MTGAELDDIILDLARLLHWKAQHVRSVRVAEKRGDDTIFRHKTPIRGDVGAPDWLLVKPPRVLFIETKGDGDVIRPEQADWGRALEHCPGVEYLVVRPKDVAKLPALLGR